MDQNNRILGEAKISKLLLKFSVPCVMGLLISALYNIVDQIFIGNSDFHIGIVTAKKRKRCPALSAQTEYEHTFILKKINKLLIHRANLFIQTAKKGDVKSKSFYSALLHRFSVYTMNRFRFNIFKKNIIANCALRIAHYQLFLLSTCGR